MMSAVHRQCRGLVRASAIACVTLGVITAPAGAQQQLGAIQGTVTDRSGAVVPGVTVTVRNLATGVTITATSNDVGVYRMPSLDPGRYEVTAELTGFRKMVERDVTVSVGATVGIDFRMQPGDLSETVEVVGRVADIQTEKAELSAVVEMEKIVDLPLVSRNPLALAGLQPGVVGIPSTASLFAPEQGLGITANGVRESGNNTFVDGITVSGNPWGGSMLIVPNVEAVQEFQIIANNASAEFGRNAGAIVSVITKGGTNELSGSAFEFNRSERLRSKNIFETAKPPYNRNEFGLSLGGPIRRDRTFFFFSYDGLRQEGGGAALRTVETEQLVNWVATNRPNSIAAQLLQRYKPSMYPTGGFRDLGGPLPGANVWSTIPDGVPDVGTVSLALTAKTIGDQFNSRIDQVLRAGSDRIRASYYVNKINTPFVYVRPPFDHDYPFLNQLLAASHSRVLSSRTLNELTVGWVRQHGETGDPTPEAPTISIAGLSYGFGVPFWQPISFTQNNLEVRNVVTLSRGTHSFRTGGEFRYTRDFGFLNLWRRPTYRFQSILDFVDDEPFSETRAVDPATGQAVSSPGTFITREWGLFFQDNWKLRQNLTLNLGLRYDNFGNPRKKEGPFNGIILGPGGNLQEQVARAKAGLVDAIYKTDWNNVAPRVGIAWDPAGDAQLVVRGGAGVSYNRINNTAFSDERLNPPLFAAATTSIQTPSVPIVYTLGPSYSPNPALGRGLDENGGIRGARVELRAIDPAITIPYVYNWFAGVQRQLGWNVVLDVSYVGSASRNLLGSDAPTSTDVNRFAGDVLDGVLDRLNRSFGRIDITANRIDASYHGLAAQVSRRYRRGFAFQVAYTVGKATDYGGDPEALNDPGREKGPADYDIRHSFKWNAIWEIPFRSNARALRALLGGWQINTVTVYQSGSPFNVTCGYAYPRCDFNADGQSGERVNLTSADLGSPSQAQWLSGVLTTADYTLPAQGTLATVGRNALRGPSYFNTDLSLFKNVRLPWGERTPTVQLRLEAFNVFNKAHLDNPVSGIEDGNFGKVVSLGRDARVIQVGARFFF